MKTYEFQWTIGSSTVSTKIYGYYTDAKDKLFNMFEHAGIFPTNISARSI